MVAAAHIVRETTTANTHGGCAPHVYHNDLPGKVTLVVGSVAQRLLPVALCPVLTVSPIIPTRRRTKCTRSSASGRVRATQLGRIA
jgi:hypothetical protein